jgi:hypothetical protein
VAALWLNVSMEGLPFAAALVALMAIRWLIDERQSERLVMTMTGLALGSLGLFVATKGVNAWQTGFCDTLTAGHLAMFGVGAAGCMLITKIGIRALHWKLLCFALLGVAGLFVLLAISPQCASGPFAHLDPLVREFWYKRIYEGQPLWRQGLTDIAAMIAFPLFGLAGSWRAFRDAEGDKRANWAILLFLLAVQILTAFMVARAGSLANLLAFPGGVYLLNRALVRARQISFLPLRVVVTLLALLIASPAYVVIAADLLLADQRPNEAARRSEKCGERAEIQSLNALPVADIAAPLDIGPAILTLTHHRIIASSHHRNQGAMHDLITIFIAPPATGRSLLAARSIEYVVVCPGMAETSLFLHYGPRGLWAHIAAGRTPDWLEPVRVQGARRMRVWRVKPAGASIPD